ncbi:GATA zinc finger domain-containing protein 7-like isoform X2 [Liolophura sinensis]|uniref:GATA zinc finger domain-containing protein 7-like isoform X2 n=1 Tax=Liolophura sinensis TaxID=3198878 RepID=UPI0031582B40
MPKDILPELRLADVAEFAPIANVEPEPFSFNFARDQNDMLDVSSHSDAGAQVMGRTAQENGTPEMPSGSFCNANSINSRQMEQSGFHGFNSFNSENESTQVTSGTSFSANQHNTFTNSFVQSFGEDTEYQAKLFTGVSHPGQMPGPISPTGRHINLCGNVKLKGQHSADSQTNHVVGNEYQAQDAHLMVSSHDNPSPQHTSQLASTVGKQKDTLNAQHQMMVDSPQHTGVNSIQQMELNMQQQMGVNGEQPMNMNESQQTSEIPEQPAGVNSQQQMGMNGQLQKEVHRQQHMDVKIEQESGVYQQSDVNLQLHMEVKSQVQVDANAQQQRELNSAGHMVVSSQQVNEIDEQQMDVSAPRHMSVHSSQQMGVNSSQQMGVSSPQQTVVNSPQQMGVNSPQQMGVNSPQQMGVNSPQQMGDGQHQMGVNNQNQIGGNNQHQMGVNINNQIQIGMNNQHQMGVNNQHQMSVNNQNQTDGNNQHQISGNSQHQISGNNQNLMGVKSQQQMDINTEQQIGMNTQHMNLNVQQHVGGNTQQSVGNTSPQQMETSSPQQTGVKEQNPMGSDSQQQVVHHQSVNAQHQVGVNEPSQMDVNMHQQTGMNSVLSPQPVDVHSHQQREHNINSQRLDMSQTDTLLSTMQQQLDNTGPVNVNNSIHHVNSPLQQFGQNVMSTSIDTTFNQSVHLNTSQQVDLSSPLQSPTPGNQQQNSVPLESSAQHQQGVFTGSQRPSTLGLKKETSNSQAHFQMEYYMSEMEKTNTFTTASGHNPSNQFAPDSSGGNHFYSPGNENVKVSQGPSGNMMQQAGNQTMDNNTFGYMASHTETNSQNMSEMMCDAANEVVSPRPDAGSFLNNTSQSDRPVGHQAATGHVAGDNHLGNCHDQVLSFDVVANGQFQSESAGGIAEGKPTSFQFGDVQRQDTIKGCPKDLGHFRNLYSDSNSSSQHVSTSTSGQASPCNLDSPYVVGSEGNLEQTSPVPPVQPSVSCNEFTESLFSRLLGQFNSSATSDSHNSTSTSHSLTTTHQSMEHDVNSQASLVAMSEQLKIMDTSKNTVFPMHMGSEFDRLLSVLNEDTIFPEDLDYKGLSSQMIKNSSELSTSTQTASSSSLSFSSQLGLTALNSHSLSTATVDSSTSGTPTPRPTSIAAESENRTFNFRKPSSEAPRVNKKQTRRNNKKLIDASLCQQFPSSANGYQLQIVEQPEDQHRARYKTEGSRGSVKDRSQQGHPTVKLVGIHQAVTLQVFVGNDSGKVKPHGFYQACKVCGKNSTPCTEREIDGTTVIELQLDPTSDMIAKIDCVGILKLRNADVEQRMGVAKAKKKSLKARLVFRVSFKCPDGGCQTLQIASHPILCTQPIGCPEICKKSMTQSPVEGGGELFIIGKNFMKGTKVLFQEVGENGETVWEGEGDIDTDYFQNTHLICSVPAYRSLLITDPVTAQVVVQCSGKTSYPQPFIYHPKVKQESMETETCTPKSFLDKVAPAALQLNEMISPTSGLFQLPADVARTIMSQKKSMKMETNQDNQACSSLLFSAMSPSTVASVVDLLRPVCNGVSKPS